MRPVICVISILRVPKPAPIDWILAFVRESCTQPVGGHVDQVENETEYVLAIEGLRPEHPLIHGGYCDCGIRQGFCSVCQGQGWVAWWGDEGIRAAERDIVRWLGSERPIPCSSDH